MTQSHKRIAVVTGGNRGLGYEVCRKLARQEVRVVLTCRNKTKGEAAAAKIRAEGGDVVFHELDVTKTESILALRKDLERDYGRVDILVNNAGIMIDSESDDWNLEESSALKVSAATVRETLETNLLGPYQLCQAFVPLMRKHGYGRIVNVSSGMGQLSEMGPGWPAYRMSKTALNALTRFLAAEVKGMGILVNSASPGWARTDMGGPSAEISAEEGADTLAWLAVLPEDGPTGGFFEDRKPMEW